MRPSASAVNLLLAFLFGVPVLCAAEPLPAKRTPSQALVFDVKLLSGDPDGSREEGTVRVLAEPVLAVAMGRRGKFHSGGQIAVPGSMPTQYVDVGTRVEITPHAIRDGKIQADVAIEVTDAVERDGRVTAETIRIRTAGTFEMGTRIRLLGPGQARRAATAGNQLWVEIAAEQFDAKP